MTSLAVARSAVLALQGGPSHVSPARRFRALRSPRRFDASPVACYVHPAQPEAAFCGPCYSRGDRLSMLQKPIYAARFCARLSAKRYVTGGSALGCTRLFVFYDLRVSEVD